MQIKWTQPTRPGSLISATKKVYVKAK